MAWRCNSSAPLASTLSPERLCSCTHAQEPHKTLCFVESWVSASDSTHLHATSTDVCGSATITPFHEDTTCLCLAFPSEAIHSLSIFTGVGGCIPATLHSGSWIRVGERREEFTGGEPARVLYRFEMMIATPSAYSRGIRLRLLPIFLFSTVALRASFLS